MEFYLEEGKQLGTNCSTLILVRVRVPKFSLFKFATCPNFLIELWNFWGSVLKFSAGSVDWKCRPASCGSVNLVSKSG